MVPAFLRRSGAGFLFVLVAATATGEVRAAGSEASALSLLPIAVVSAAPVALIASGARLSVVGVQASGNATVWVLERASDGARATLRLAGNASVAVGTTVEVTAMSVGWVLSAAGKAIACIPNEVGASLLYSERVTR